MGHPHELIKLLFGSHSGQLTKERIIRINSNCGLRRVASLLLKMEIPYSRNERVHHPKRGKGLPLDRVVSLDPKIDGSL
jgi:hypothetical protein